MPESPLPDHGSSPRPPEPAPSWQWLAFDDLSVHALDAIYRARQQVFTVEQRCAFLDADGIDPGCFHLAAWAPGHDVPLAYARVVPPGLKYAEASIGRVLTTAAARGTGLGRELVGRAIRHCRQTFPAQPIRIGAQSRLEHFYRGFGFVVTGEPYLEDGIAHTEMLRAAD